MLVKWIVFLSGTHLLFCNTSNNSSTCGTFESVEVSFYTSLECLTYTDCFTCIGGHRKCYRCQWCDIDSRCHTIPSTTNPCYGNRDRVNLKPFEPCVFKNYGSYSPSTAFESTIFSAIAYSNDPQKCLDQVILDRLIPDVGFELLQVIEGMFNFNYTLGFDHLYGFIAVSHSRKEFVLAYRGTAKFLQLLNEAFTIALIPKEPFRAGGNVETYFLNAHRSLYACVKSSIQTLVRAHPDYSLLITGHSLGGALASLAAISLVYDNVLPATQISLYTFGMPRVGDMEYALAHDKLISDSWRVVRFKDIFTHLPKCFSRACMGLEKESPYHHRTKVLYPEGKMTKNSTATVCNGNAFCLDPVAASGVEWSLCVNFTLLREKPLLAIWKAYRKECIDYHKNYFSIPVGTFCDETIGKSILKLFSIDNAWKWFFQNKCRILKLKELHSSRSSGYTISLRVTMLALLISLL